MIGLDYLLIAGYSFFASEKETWREKDSSKPVRDKKMSEDMTKEEIKKIYHAVKSAYGGKIDIYKAFYSVETMLSSNVAFLSYCRAFGAMQTGSVYKRPIGGKLTRCFLDLIHADFGSKGLKLALKALKKHIDHRQTFDSSRKMETYIQIYEEYIAKSKLPSGIDETVIDELKTLIDSAPEPKTAPTFALGDDNLFYITPPPDNQPVNSQDVSLKTLRETIEALLESRIGANAHLELTPIIEEYKEAISSEKISISHLYWSGIKLDNAVQIIKQGIAAKEQPSLPFTTELNLKTALDAHGNYIMSNAEGQQLVQDATAYRQSAEQKEALKQASEQFADSVAENQVLFDADVRKHVYDVLMDIGKGQHQERSNQSAGNTLTNLVSSVFKATGTFAVMTIIEGAVVASIHGMAVSALGAEAINAAGFFLVNNAHLLLMLAAPLAGEQSWLASAAHLLERIRLITKNY